MLLRSGRPLPTILCSDWRSEKPDYQVLKTLEAAVCTFGENLDDITGVEAELIRVLGVIGIERSALGGSGFWFGSTRPRRRFYFL